jgi:hypothetical protein
MKKPSVIGWALGLGLRGHSLIALLALLEEADGGLVCSPSIVTLSALARTSEKALVSGIRGLQARGVVKVTFGGTRGITNTYRILAPADIVTLIPLRGPWL